MNQAKLPFSDMEEPAPDVYPGAFLNRSDRSPYLVSVDIDGLKGFDHVEIELRRLTILTGPNNSGKSTILQAIALAFECFRRCLDVSHWKLRSAGRAVSEFEFLPVNQPKDLWFKQVWKPSKDKERYVRVGLRFSNDFKCAVRLRFMYGLLNVGIEAVEGSQDEATLKEIAGSAPVLLPATPGPSSHEDHISLAQVHRLLNIREPNRVVRNVLLRLQEDLPALNFVKDVLNRYFSTNMDIIAFDETRDLEIRAPLREQDYSLDVVSAGSGLNQILQLASIIAWRKPGIVLLDEPDAHLHSSVQAQLLDFLTELVDEFKLQVVLATHSKDLIGRAPLETIVPVDRTRSKLGPLASIDHLLLEYQRQGTVSNVDLALLYQTKRCVFVEGPTDARLLPRLAERLRVPLFLGRDQLVLFEFSGVDKLKLLPELVKLFERLVGAKLRWGAIRDSDANIPEIKGRHEQVAQELGIPVFHQWGRYGIENYLIEPFLIAATIKRKAPEINLDAAAIETLLDEAIAAVEDNVSGPFVTKTQTAYRLYQMSENPFDAGASAATRYLRSLNTREAKIAAYPGKRIFGAVVEALQAKHKVNIRLDDLIGEITPDNAPEELMRCFEKLQAI
jgi:predicted ATPase